MRTNTKEEAGRHRGAGHGAPGRVFWITGLSGAGKTTLGQELCSRLRSAGRSVTFLDGDALRAVIAEDLGHSADNRRRSAMRNARLCRLLAEQGADVVCATISLFHEVQRWNRDNIPGYREIYLRVPLDELQRRDSKGIYAGAQRGDACNVVGIDVPAEVPEGPDLVLDNYGALDVATAVDRILAVCPKGVMQALRRPSVSSRSKRRRNLWKHWHRCCAMGASCHRSDSRLALERRWRALCRHRCAVGFRSGHCA
jgi:cytidine diphosphoramidate kinase